MVSKATKPDGSAGSRGLIRERMAQTLKRFGSDSERQTGGLSSLEPSSSLNYGVVIVYELAKAPGGGTRGNEGTRTSRGAAECTCFPSVEHRNRDPERRWRRQRHGGALERSSERRAVSLSVSRAVGLRLVLQTTSVGCNGRESSLGQGRSTRGRPSTPKVRALTGRFNAGGKVEEVSIGGEIF